MSHDNKGFTLVELMLAMTFISVLLLAIAMTTIQIGRIYNKGITLREVNQVGREVSSDLERSIAASSPFVVSGSTNSNYIERPGGGRLCLGRYSYAWNYGSALVGGTGAPAIFNTYDNNSQVRFARVNDASGSLCTNPTTQVPRNQSTELLSAGDRNLAVHKFSIIQGAQDSVTDQALYAVSLTLGTNDRSQLSANDTSCRPPSEVSGGEDYCAVNRFDMVVRAGNKAGGE